MTNTRTLTKTEELADAIIRRSPGDLLPAGLFRKTLAFCLMRGQKDWCLEITPAGWEALFTTRLQAAGYRQYANLRGTWYKS